MIVKYKTIKNDSIQGLSQFIFTMPPESFIGNLFTTEFIQTMIVYDSKGELIESSLTVL